MCIACSRGVKKCENDTAVRVGYPSAGPKHSPVSSSRGSTSDDITWKKITKKKKEQQEQLGPCLNNEIAKNKIYALYIKVDAQSVG